MPVVVVVVVSLPGPVVFANAYGLTARLKSDGGNKDGEKKTRMRIEKKNKSIYIYIFIDRYRKKKTDNLVKNANKKKGKKPCANRVKVVSMVGEMKKEKEKKKHGSRTYRDHVLCLDKGRGQKTKLHGIGRVRARARARFLAFTCVIRACYRYVGRKMIYIYIYVPSCDVYDRPRIESGKLFGKDDESSPFTS